MNENMDTKETMSALADGQLAGDDFARAVALAATGAQAADAWHTYHLIGDVLRSGELAGGTPHAQFMHKLAGRLAQEPAIAMQSIADEAMPVRAAGLIDARESANDGSFRWKLVAGVASLAAVAAVGWSVVGGLTGGAAAQPQLASAPAGAGQTVVQGTDRGPMIRDARLDELMAAHRQFGGPSALQAPAGFTRNAAFEAPAR